MDALTQLYVCRGIPWDDGYKHVRLFASASDAHNFIVGKQAYSFSQLSYISKNGVTAVRVPGYADQFKTCNYLAFLNSGYTTKWIYAFIRNVQYLADGTAVIEYVEDIFQTYFYDCSLQPCFVEREHVNNDTIGENTVPENIVMGDPIAVNAKLFTFPHMWNMYVSQLAPGVESMGLTIINPGDAGNKTSGFYKIELGNNLTNVLTTVVELYTQKGMLEAINSVFATTDIDSSGVDVTISSIDNFGDYTPKNNKLLCYPYNYFSVVMPGSETPFRFEFFPNRVGLFAVRESRYPGGSGYIYPISYQFAGGARDDFMNLENSVITGAYPQASFGASQFQNYLAQQGPAIAIGLVGSVGAVVGGIGTANVAAAAGGLTGIANTVADIYRHALVSETVKGTQAVSNIAYESALYIRVKNMQIRPEYAKIIDDYLSAFGYKVCRIKAPNLTGRASWNFVKTIDCVVDGNAPDAAIKSLREMFDRGVTLWHTNDVGNYTLNNKIMGGE